MSDPIELEPGGQPLEITPDRRPPVPEPLPVKLIAIADVRLPAPAGVERKLDRLYVDLLGFQRGPERPDQIVYVAENFYLLFDIGEPPVTHADYVPTGIEVPSLFDLNLKFIEAEVEFERQKGINPADDRFVLLDPAGNWIAITETKIIV
ncbi:MAG: hypothetical protein QM770_04005 [Tepidisphaeraceae bacterium]